MLGDDLSVWDFLSSMTFPWLLMIFQSSMTFHDFSRKLYFSRFSRPCGNPVNGACHPGGHCWNYYPGTLSCSQVPQLIWRSGTRRWNLRVSENQIKMRHLDISSTGIQFSNELQWLDLLTHLLPSDAILWHRSESTLVQVRACCLTAPSHYLNQRWLIISKVQWPISQEVQQP